MPDPTIDKIMEEMNNAEKNKNIHFLIDIIEYGCQRGELSIEKALKQVAQGIEYSINYFKAEKIYSPAKADFVAMAVKGMGDSTDFVYKERKAEIEEVINYFEGKQLLKTIEGEIIRQGMKTKAPDRIELLEDLKKQFELPEEEGR